MRFLCLHGRATCAQIFEMQTARIREELDDHEFVFVNGSIPVDPMDATAALLTDDSYGFIGETLQQHQELLDSLIDFTLNQGPFDGLMGFSEGGVVAAMLLAEDARRPFGHFRCGIFFSSAPPLDPDGIRRGDMRCLDPSTDGVQIRIPTAHVYSKNGETSFQSPLAKLWSQAGWGDAEQIHGALTQLCDDTQVFVHDLGHDVPGASAAPALKGTLRVIERTLEMAEA